MYAGHVSDHGRYRSAQIRSSRSVSERLGDDAGSVSASSYTPTASPPAAHRSLGRGLPPPKSHGRGAAEEAGSGVGFLVGVDIGVGEAGLVVDGAVHVVEADPAGVAGPSVLQAVSS